MNTCHPHPPATNRPPQKGFAIALIMVAVALVATLGIVIAYTSNNSYGTSYMPKANALAAGVIAQARNLRAGVDTITSRGVAINTITLDTSSNTGLFNPSTGGTEMQQPIAAATNSTSSTWIWKVDGSGNPVVKLYNVGISSNADYVAVLTYINQAVCSMIDTQLNGTGAVPAIAVTTSSLATPATAVDLSASNSGTQGWPDGCYALSDGQYAYITTIRAQ